MDQERNSIAEKSQSKVVLIVALLLSLLSFSGQEIYQSNKDHAVKTEQINSINKFSKKNKAITNVSLFENTVVATYSDHERLPVLLAYTRAIKVSIGCINREALTFRKPIEFLVFSNVTHHSDEDDRISTAG
jgi:hypothetical protein